MLLSIYHYQIYNFVPELIHISLDNDDTEIKSYMSMIKNKITHCKMQIIHFISFLCKLFISTPSSKENNNVNHKEQSHSQD